MMSDWKNCWVINVKNPLDCWLIDEDSTKPIYLENDFPKYDRSRMMQYRLCNHPSEEYQAKHPQKKEMDGQISIFDYLEDEEACSVELKGICDDAYCPNCGRPLDDGTLLDCERCPDCNIKLDWKRWHDHNDEFCHQCSTCGAFNEVWKASYKACFSATSPNAGRQMKPSDRCEHWEEPEEDWFPEVEG